MTGWLIWCTPEVAWTTPLAELEAALRGRMDFLRKTNPWRTKEEAEADRIAEMPPDPESGKRFFETLLKIAKPLPKRNKNKVSPADHLKGGEHGG